MSHRQETGLTGEKEAKHYLEKRGYKILARNFRSTFGEIDLICREKENLVFVEVKTRGSNVFGEGLEAVDSRKQEKLMKTALYYMKRENLENLPYRFDVISIQSGKIDHVINAFS